MPNRPIHMQKLPEAFRNPTPRESRSLLASKWKELAPSLQTPNQLFGRHQEGCGATIGAMPRCDFACKGCYLSANANRIPACTVDEIKQQIDQLRTFLGPKGNLQLTDGEVTLRDTDEVIEIIQYARKVGLTPMLMTHGDTFRQDERLLPRLVTEGGLRELSIHIDTTQRGRLGYKHVKTEAELHPLRAEFADHIRAIRRETGIALRTASTVTVTRENFPEIGGIFETLMQHADVYHLVSFLPAAQVGRSEDGFGGGVRMQDIWDQLSETTGQDFTSHKWQQGHADCNTMITGVSLHESGQPIRFHPLPASGSEKATRFPHQFLERFGGIDFRDDSAKDMRWRTLGLCVQAPKLMLWDGLRWLWHQAGIKYPGERLKRMRQWRRGDLRMRPFSVVVHQFMSREEVETPLGQERLAHCTFKVSDGDRLISMCEMNTLGHREPIYKHILDTQYPEPEIPHAEPVHS